MTSLVADYGSSSESETDTPVSLEKTGKAVGNDDTRSGGVNYLSLDATVSDSSDSDNGDIQMIVKQNEGTGEKLPNPLAENALPSPSEQLEKGSKPVEHSVFVNPFQKAQEAKDSVLEKHVKMTVQETQHKKGKKICYKFRKGKCRFGRTCKFAHDTDDIIVSNRGEDNKPQTTSDSSLGKTEWSNEETETEIPTETKRKKRPGITNNLFPTKRARDNLDRQRLQERPWTVQW